MPILARYVGRSIIAFTALVMAALAILFALYLFANEQDDIGVGSYGAGDALMFSLLTLPRSLGGLLPIGALIGALFGLGNLARSSELTVMRAAGVSVMRIGGWAAAAGAVLAVFGWVIVDYIAPPLEHYARQHKIFAKSNDISLTANQGAWAKDGNTFISVQQQSDDNRFGGVYVFRFDAEHRLQSVAHARVAHADDRDDGQRSRRWRLSDYAESSLQFQDDELRVTTAKESTHELQTGLSPDFLGLAAMEPDLLPGRVLFDYIRHARANALDARLYETALWARIARTAALVFVVMLAVPFALGPPRGGSPGLRTVVGSLVGVGFFVLAKILEDGGRVFKLDPWVIAWTPTALLAAVAFVALARIR